ncbi:hypothetical protein LMG29542_07792 [Paraburkholderia humisilvae]|uniref:Uncharacterized protein n=1 Tax=Paraburkholderia humisilvae TaxID=627669 RepID=A0A6J5F7R1_9BURK|nr:hypothetical protein LMG29542_07792 [Paraburkholderia humisilvae]
MSVRFLFALLARGRAEVLKGIARMHELGLKRQAEAFLLGKALGLVAYLLGEPLDVQVALMQCHASPGVRLLLRGKGSGRARE